MDKINTKELVEIIRKHKMWLVGEKGGERADLSSADLSSANLALCRPAGYYFCKHKLAGL